MIARAPKKVLSLPDCVAIIVGIVIGAGIFRLPSVVAGQINSDGTILFVWLLGGLISFIGALCYAELATAYPSTGGEYHFLTRAYGRDVGFMFAWARMSVVQTGSIALLAYIFGDYTAKLAPLGTYGPSLYASAAVIALTALNVAGVRQTKSVQNVLASVTVCGLLCVIGVGAAYLVQNGAVEPIPPQGEAVFSSAVLGSSLILVLLTYGGWNEAAYISAEVKDGERNMVRALLLSIGLITAIYVAVNFVYLKVLGTAGVAASQAVATDVMTVALGPAAGMFITLLIMVKALASANVTIFTGARTNYALGGDFPLFRFLHQWSASGGAPVRALLLQGAIALGLIFLGAVNRSGVQTAVDYLAPVFWLFFLLTGLALFRLRRREPAQARPFRVPLYPLTPLLFCATCLYMLYSSVSYTGRGAFAGVIVLALGLPILIFARRRSAAAPSDTPA